MLVKMNCGRAWAEIGSIIFSSDGINGVLAQVTFFGSQFHGFAGRIFESELVIADRAIDIENNAAGILADGLGFVFGKRDVLVDDFHRAFGDGAFLFLLKRSENGLVHVIRDFRGGPADQFEQRILQYVHRAKAREGCGGVQATLQLCALVLDEGYSGL